MLNWLTSSLQLDISPNRVVLLRTCGWRTPRKTEVLVDRTYEDGVLSSREGVETQLRKVLDDAKVVQCAVTVILADEWVRYFTVTPPHNAVHQQDCVAAAGMRFQSLYDASPVDWHVDADWNALQPFLACAMPSWLLEALIYTASGCNLVLLGIRPRFIAAWGRWKNRVPVSTWFGTVHTRQLSLSPLQGKRLTAVRTLPIPEHATESFEWLAASFTRAALLQGVPTPTHIHLCGPIPPAWTAPRQRLMRVTRLGSGSSPDETAVTNDGNTSQMLMTHARIDFAPRSLRRAVALVSPATWLVGLTGLAFCLALAVQVQPLLQQYRSGQAELERLHVRLKQRHANIPSLTPWTIPEEQATAVNKAIAQLNLPWRDVLDAIEAATPPTIALLSLEPNAAQHQLKVVAEAQTGDAMVAYVERLKRFAFFDAVVLTRHETNEQDPNKPLRFQFEAHWPEGVQ